ncbi:hypothetical protein PIB30_009734 [Stylosanthes scabra]|uniref:Uncharacterized protein n=1 Tax=Stylosanthes scabra TaxID=79078 RepID=A0ABU6W4P9_9FABA|nr:hypothetical protein [Stylosanthes scabra]
MKAFQSVCWYLQLDLSLRAFLYFFHLTRPFSQKKSRWASFRAREGRRIFTLYEESFHDFKNYYFKVRAVEGFHPFFENEQGEYQFRLYWYSGPESPKYDFDDLDGMDQEIVTVLKECCVKVPFNTKTLLTRSPSYIRTELEKMTNNSDAYKHMRARKKNQANRLAAASGSKESPKSTAEPVSKVPPPGSESQPVTNQAEFKRIQALQKKLADCPPTSRAEVDQLKEKLASLVKEKEEAEEELSGAKSELSKLKKSVKEADQLRRKAEAETAELKVKVGTLEADLEDNYVVGDRIVWCGDLLPESEGPYFEDEAAEVGDAEKTGPQSGADDAEKTPHV